MGADIRRASKKWQKSSWNEQKVWRDENRQQDGAALWGQRWLRCSLMSPNNPPPACLPATLTGSSPAPPWEWAGEVGHYQAECVRRRLAANVTNTNESPWAIFAFSRTNLSLKCKKSCIWTSGILFAAFYFTLDDEQKRMNTKQTNG